MSDSPSKIEDPTVHVEEDIVILRAEVAALSQQLNELIEVQRRHPVTDAANVLAGRASGVYETISERGKNRLDEVSTYVKAQPIQSILLAAAAGLILSKTLLR